MSDTMDSMAPDVDQQELAQQLLAQAREQGIDLVGPDGLLNRLTKNVLEDALEAEMGEMPTVDAPKKSDSPDSHRWHTGHRKGCDCSCEPAANWS